MVPLHHVYPIGVHVHSVISLTPFSRSLHSFVILIPFRCSHFIRTSLYVVGIHRLALHTNTRYTRIIGSQYVDFTTRSVSMTTRCLDIAYDGQNVNNSSNIDTL